MSQSKDNKKKPAVKSNKRNFFFPDYGFSVQAENIEEANKLAEKRLGKNKN